MIKKSEDISQIIKQILESGHNELLSVEKHIDRIRPKLADLKHHSESKSLWDDPERAGQILKELSQCESKVENFDRHKENLAAFQILSSENDVEVMYDEIVALCKSINESYIETLFTDPDDDLPCFIEIKAGSGGTEAQDWAEMLFNMYYKFGCSEYCAEIIDLNKKDVGIDSATIKLDGHANSFPYGFLKGETGTHRLVRPSPYNKNNKRHTSFAEVFVGPVKETSINIVINDADIRIDTYRASGAGGQHVNKTDSAVRITHIPSGIVVQCQNDRSQHKNKAEAMKVLKSKLYAEEVRKNASSVTRKGPGGWGNQIRSYVLDDSRVTDLRTGFESRQPDRVLNGEIRDFLKAYVSMDKL